MALTRIDTITSGVQGSPYFTALYFDVESPEAAQSAATAVVEFWADVRTLMLEQATMQVQNVAVTVDPLTGQPVGTYPVTGATIIGGGGTVGLSWATQALIQWRTGLYMGGREIRGRTFIPAIASSAGNSVPSGTSQSTLSDAGAQLASAINAPLVVWSRTKGISAAVQTATGWNQYAVLRSRRD